MSDLKQTMQRAREFIAANLAECCRDELDWQNTALLRDGKLRDAAAIYSKVDTTHAIPLAQAEVARQAMQFASRTQPEATAQAQDLSAAILALPCLGTMSQFASLGDLKLYQEGHKEALEAAAALASSANALSAGDRVDAKTPASIVSNHEFMRALEAYTDTFPRAGKEALIDLRKTSDYGLIAAIDAAILQSQKGGSDA